MVFVRTVIPVVITEILFTTIAGILVVTRVVSRYQRGISSTDDWLALGALASSILFCVVIFEQIKYGLGTSKNEIENIGRFLMCLWGTIPCYNMSLSLTKLSITFQYMRIFTTPRIRRFCWIMVGILVIYGLWTVIGSALMCIPAQTFWRAQDYPNGKCLDQKIFWFTNASLNIATDVLIFAIPMPLLGALQLPKRQKIGLMVVFGFGAFVCVTSIIRLKSLYEISNSADPPLEGVNTAIWSGIEINVAVACASLPALKPLFSRFLPGLLSSNKASNYYRQTSGSHGLTDFRSRGHSKLGTGCDEERDDGKIRAQTTITQTRSGRDIQEGSEHSLTGYKADIYIADTHPQRVLQEQV